MWDLIVSVPDHCLSFYFTNFTNKVESKLMKTRPNRVSKSDTTTKTDSTLKRSI